MQVHVPTSQKVRAELAPWEARINAARSAADVAGAERDLLLQQQEAAKTRLRVRVLPAFFVLRHIPQAAIAWFVLLHADWCWVDSSCLEPTLPDTARMVRAVAYVMAMC